MAIALLVVAGAGAQAAPVLLTPDGGEVPLAGHIDYLCDDTGQMTLEQVRTPEFAARFAPSEGASFKFGFTSAACWFRTRLHNPATPAEPGHGWVLELGFPTFDYVDVHLVSADGHTETFLTGDHRQAPPQQLPARGFDFPLAVPPGAELSLYARAANGGAFFFTITLWSDAGFQEKSAAENLVYGGFFGVMLVMALYNLIIWFRVRDRAYLYFVFALVSFTVLVADLSGYARQYGNGLFAGAPLWIHNSFPLAGLLATFFMLMFGREFVQTRTNAPLGDRAILILAGLSLAAVLLRPLLSYTLAVQLMLAFSLISILTLIPATLYLAWQGLRSARLYLLAFGVFSPISSIGTLQILGYLPGGFFTAYSVQIGLILAVTLLSLALADRLNGERRERERLTRLKNFFAPQVAEAILDEGGGNLLAPKRREVTVMFTDLRGFTAFAAQSEPEEVIRVLREYHEAVVETAARHGGNVEHIAGDGVMLYFNAPLEVSEPEVRAVRLAFDLRGQFEALVAGWRKRGHELGVGIGMACGFATVGAVGAKGRMDYSCIGTVTNLAARLCAQAAHGQILAPQLFVNRVEALVTTESLGEQELKGIPRPVPVLNLVALKPQAAPAAGTVSVQPL